MAIIRKGSKYKWDFENIGGTPRVKISAGKDIENLYQLDPKMWTVLSCPVHGLDIDEKMRLFKGLRQRVTCSNLPICKFLHLDITESQHLNHCPAHTSGELQYG